MRSAENQPNPLTLLAYAAWASSGAAGLDVLHRPTGAAGFREVPGQVPVNARAVAGVNVERPLRASAVNWQGRGTATLRPVRPGVSSAGRDLDRPAVRPGSSSR